MSLRMRVARFPLFDTFQSLFDISAMTDGTRKSLCSNGYMMSAKQ